MYSRMFSAVVAYPFQIVDHVEEGADQTVVLLRQIQGMDLDQVAGNGVVQEIQHLLILKNLLPYLLVRLKKHLYG